MSVFFYNNVLTEKLIYMTEKKYIPYNYEPR